MLQTTPELLSYSDLSQAGSPGNFPYSDLLYHRTRLIDTSQSTRGMSLCGSVLLSADTNTSTASTCASDIALRPVSLSKILAIIQTLNDCISQDVELQLKILQTLYSLITNFPTIRGRRKCTCFRSVLPLLFPDGWTTLRLRFRLHESRAAVVSSMPAATLRQSTMFVVDKVVEEHRRMLLSNELESIIPPDEKTQAL
jgi:Dimerisation and cyclophilin-binding domain of Mon2